MIAAAARWRSREMSTDGVGLAGIAGIVVVAAFIQSVLPRFDLWLVRGTPNLMVAVVVMIAVYRGVMVGAVVGFAGGILVELWTPSATLGVLALVFVAIGAWCGRFAERTEPLERSWSFVLCLAASAVVPIWVGVVELLRGSGPPLSFIIGELTAPQMLFAPLMTLPALWMARRFLVTPRVVEPWMVSA